MPRRISQSEVAPPRMSQCSLAARESSALRVSQYLTCTTAVHYCSSNTTMPAATSDQSAGRDDLDNLLDYDGAVEDFWKDLPDTNGGNANDTNNAAQPEMDMDEEVKVTKKRKPNPKLDQELYVGIERLHQ